MSRMLVPVMPSPTVVRCSHCQKYFWPQYYHSHLQTCVPYLRAAQRATNTIMWRPETPVSAGPTYDISSTMFNDLVRGKRVIIVGPSITAQNCKLGRFVDQFDVVVRLNKSLPIPTQQYAHIGSRVDILYNSLNTSDFPGQNNVNPAFLRTQKVRYVRCPYPPIIPFKSDIKAFQQRNRGIVPFGHIDFDFYQKMRTNLQTRPYTGTCAIADLLNSGVRELFIMGIDFYTYGYAKYYRSVSDTKLEKLRDNTVHKRTPQIDLVRRFYLLDKRLIVDDILDKILLEPYDRFSNTMVRNAVLDKVFVSCTNTFISHNHLLMRIADMAESKKNNIERLTVCLADPKTQRVLDGYDIVVQMLSGRTGESMKKTRTDIYVVRDTSQIKDLPHGVDVIVAQPLMPDKKYGPDDAIGTDARYAGQDPERILFLNPIVARYFRQLIGNVFNGVAIVPGGTLSAEMFMLTITCLLMGEIEVYAAGINLFDDWVQYPDTAKVQACAQRMLCSYFVRRGLLKILT